MFIIRRLLPWHLPRRSSVVMLALMIAVTSTAQAEPSITTDSQRFMSVLSKQLLNRTGVSAPGLQANLDGSGNAYVGAEFPDLPGTLSVQGVPFTLQRKTGGSDHYVPNGAPVPLPSGSNRIYILGTRTGGSDPGTMQVQGQNGTTTELPVLLTDWCQSPRYGELEAFSANERATPAGLEVQPNHLWATSIELPPNARALQFPSDESLHIFSLTADTGNPPVWSTPPPPAGYSTLRVPPISDPLPPAAPVIGTRNLGFVVHAGQPGQEEYRESGSHSMLLNLFAWGMRNRAKQLVDFTVAEKWLHYLYRTGIQAAIIIDTSIHHTNAAWRSQETSSRGENVRDQAGQQTSFSSPHSPRYREMVEQYARDITSWVTANDPERRVRAYVNGAEVFWPGVLDWGSLAQAKFREWLLREYSDLQSVNNRWGASFASIDEVEGPPFWNQGNLVYGPNTFVYKDYEEGSWSAGLGPVSPGATYELSVEVNAERIPNDFAGLQITFTGPGRDPQVQVVASTGVTSGKWLRLEGTATAPAWAQHAVFAVTLKGAGRTQWRNPKAARAFVSENLVPNPILERDTTSNTTTAPLQWTFSSRRDMVRGSIVAAADGETGSLVLEAAATKFPYKYPSAAWHDFVTFSMESYAQVMNGWARLIKSLDPTREVMHYVGYLLGTLSEWDYLTLTQRPDIFLTQAPDADVNGLQLCAGRGDFHYATIVLDLARKYGKPLVATDLQDFTHGVYVGFNSLNRTSLACVAHGMTGVYYYNWFGTPDYSWFNSWAPQDTQRMVWNVEKAVTFLDGTRPEIRTAFLLPLLPYCEADPGGQKADMLDSMGWYKLLRHSGIQVDVYTPYELEHGQDLAPNKYSLLVVPDAPFLPVTVAEKIREYVRSGGTLLLGGRPPQFDETGRALETPFLPAGVTAETTAGTQRRIPADRALATTESLRILPPGLLLAGDATLVDTHAAWPGILEQKLGRGTITWTGGMDGRGYLGPVRRYAVAGNTPPLFLPDGDWKWPRPEGIPLLTLIRELTAQAAPADVRLSPPDGFVELSVHHKGEERRLLLIHTGEGLHRGGDITFRTAGEGEPEVWADFDQRPAVTRRSGSEITLRLPDFADCCMIRY